MLKFIDKGINFNALKGINGNEELIEIIKKSKEQRSIVNLGSYIRFKVL